MELFTALQLKKLMMNGMDHNNAMAQNLRDAADRWPVVRLTDGVTEWLLTEMDPEEPNVAFGLIVDAFGCANIGYVNVAGLQSAFKVATAWEVVNDDRFNPTMAVSEYAYRARVAHETAP